MLSDPSNFLYLSVFAALAFWSLPARAADGRRWVLIGFSAFFIYSISPPSLLLCSCVGFIAYFSTWLTRHLDTWLVPAVSIVAIVATLILSELYFPPLDYYREYVTAAIPVTLGLSYAVLKSIALVVDSYQQRNKAAPTRLSHALLLNLFFPIHTAGPIERPQSFSDTSIGTRFDPDATVGGIMRIMVGLFKIGFIADVVLTPTLTELTQAAYDPASTRPVMDYYFYIWLVFLNLYFNFSGYTDVAIGTGRLFSINLMENFRFPFLARNIQEFWQRWHLSLGQYFVMTYMFYPLARATRGRVNLSILVSFAVIGLWHELTWHYFLWGILQGVGLVAVTYYKRAMDSAPSTKRVRENWLHAGMGWLLTMTYVSWTVGIAVSGGVSQSLTLTAHLVGF